MVSGTTNYENGLHVPITGVEVLPQGCVLIAGAGPVGLTLSYVLASYGVKSVVLERNETTTQWPKMDLTNVRSMELFRKLGLADELRKQGRSCYSISMFPTEKLCKGVQSHIPQPVLISTGLKKGTSAISTWHHPGVDEFRVRIARRNDGTMPLEPWQRLSQADFERWLKDICDKNPFIDLRFGCKLESVEEWENGVRVLSRDSRTGVGHYLVTNYLVGCDGGSSKVRRSLKIALDGGPMPVYVLLVHFKSRDLARLHAQGQFWHIFFIGEHGLASSIIAQNEVDTWTTHLLLPLDTDPEAISTEEVVYRALGGIHGSYEIKIDEVLVRSTYRPNIAIARQYSGFNGKVYLAGDAAHQNIPTGGYGMNMGIADAFELGWKLAAVLNGHANPAVLKSYEEERRPTAMASIERSGVHMRVHMEANKVVNGQIYALDADTEEGRVLRDAVKEYYEKHNGENTDHGIEMGYRYKSSIIVPDGSKEPEWTPSEYVATTFPGSRAPHVFLRDGSAIFDHCGRDYTLVDFAGVAGGDGDGDGSARFLVEAAWRRRVPVKHLVLTDEANARSIWERRLVLVRPDGHVAWRGDAVADFQTATDVFAMVSGEKAAKQRLQANDEVVLCTDPSQTGEGAFSFTSTIGLSTQTSNYALERMGGFQS